MDGDLVGRVIGERYELLDVIGRGGQGVVCRALDRNSGTHVAVKVIEGKAARNPDTIERVAREQQALIALAGTHAVGFLDMCTSDEGELCLVMELLQGREFERYLVELENRGDRISVAKLIEVLTPIAETLDKAHSVGIIHRDLKPGNIFLMSPEAGGGSRLLDFGFARLRNSRLVTHNGMVMGSPSFIAPEMWQGFGRRTDHRVDVYAFGVIIYRALAGELPFANTSMQQILIAATTKPRPSLHRRRPELPRDVDRWVWRALAIEPDARHPSVGACWDELLTVVGADEAPAVSRSGLTEPPPDLHKIRTWIQEGPSQRTHEAQSVWTMAAQALKRLIGRSEPAPAGASGQRPDRAGISPVPPPIRPMPTVRPGAKIPTTPPPLPPKAHGSRAELPAPARVKRKPGPTIIIEPSIELSARHLLPLGPESERAFRREKDGSPSADPAKETATPPNEHEALPSAEPIRASEAPPVAPPAVDAEARPPAAAGAEAPAARTRQRPTPAVAEARSTPKLARAGTPIKFDKPKWKSRRKRKRK